MKKITLFIFVMLACSSNGFSQTYTSGTMTFFADYSGKIDVTSTTVTLTLIGPSTSWMGVGFNATSMGDVGMDCVIFDGTAVTDRTLNGVGVTPPLDATQNWSISSNTVAAGVRTAVLTRARSTGDSNDYTFPNSPQTLNIIFARRPGSTVIGYHGGGNCDTTIANLTLGTQDFEMSDFIVYPNPTQGVLKIKLTDRISNGEVKIYDDSGRLVVKKSISQNDNTIDTTVLMKGNYIVVFRSDYGNTTKNIIVN